MELLCSLLTPYNEKNTALCTQGILRKENYEWGTHFHHFYRPSFVKVKMVETTTELAFQALGGNGGNNFRIGPHHNGGNGGNNFNVGTHNPMVEMMEMMELTSLLASNTIVEMVETT